jgi:protoporphyrinogen oxidase
MSPPTDSRVTIVGGGFTGLSAAYELAKAGVQVVVLEAEGGVGGLATAFEIGGGTLDRYYHHWYLGDQDVMRLIDDLGMRESVRIHPTNTGVYHRGAISRLSTPFDLLKFSPLGFLDRIRLGAMVLRARRVEDWRALESKTARDWLLELGGKNVYRVVWEPLLDGKFGPFAQEVSAVWFWNKLKLRGGSRGWGGEERLACFKGGFVALAEELANRIRAMGGRIVLGSPVSEISKSDGRWIVSTKEGVFRSDRVLCTTALPLLARMIKGWAPSEEIAKLERIEYLGNVCMVLELDRALSRTYWLNVNDPGFPFVGVIEHTNFERPETYGGRHVVYLSKYVPHTDRLFSLDADGFLEFAFPYLERIFPAIRREWVLARHLWRARWSQPVVEKGYGGLIPAEDGPGEGLHVCSMAQIYPEDRGTSQAIREGRRIGRKLAAMVQGS